MERLIARGKKPSSAEAFALLRIGGTIVVGLAVLLGTPASGTGFLAVLAVAGVYAIALAARAARDRPDAPRVATSFADVGLLLALVAFSGGAVSEVRLALVVYPAAMALVHPPRAVALVTAFAAAGFGAVAASSLGPPAADTA